MILVHNTKLQWVATKFWVIIFALFALNGCIGYRYKPNLPSAALASQVINDIPGVIVTPSNSRLTPVQLSHYLANPKLITPQTPAFQIVTIEQKEKQNILHIQGFSRRFHQLDVFNTGYLDDFQIPLKGRDNIIGYTFEYKGYINNVYFSAHQEERDKQLPLKLHTTPISSYRIQLIYQNGQLYDFDYQAEIVDVAYQSSYNYQDPNFELRLFTKLRTPLYIQFLYADGHVINKKYQSTFYLKESRKERFPGFNGELSIYRDSQSGEFSIIKF